MCEDSHEVVAQDMMQCQPGRRDMNLDPGDLGYPIDTRYVVYILYCQTQSIFLDLFVPPPYHFIVCMSLKMFASAYSYSRR
jgi:hypothetical protein